MRKSGGDIIRLWLGPPNDFTIHRNYLPSLKGSGLRLHLDPRVRVRLRFLFLLMTIWAALLTAHYFGYIVKV